MYEPFCQAIDRYDETYSRGPDHLNPPDAFEAFLVKCDTCGYRQELQCPKCKCRGGKSCIRMAELPESVCPLEVR